MENSIVKNSGRTITGLIFVVIAALVATLLVSPADAAPSKGKPDKGTSVAPVVVGHRGASGYRPEHTLASYELAAKLGADFIEPDLVSTKDGVLVARHENEIGGTTDVADHPEFADRKTTKVIDGKEITGWFTEDFTLAELKTLRAKERLPKERQQNTIYDGQFEVPTFDEVLELREQLSKELGRKIGVYPETKHPTYFQSIGLSLEPGVVAALKDHQLNKAKAPVIVQSFELTNLQQLRTELGLKTPSAFLTSASGAPYDLESTGDERTYADLVSPEGLAEISEFVTGIGPVKDQVIPREADGALGEPTSLVADAHEAGLVVHPYTFRAENTFLPVDYRNGSNPADYGKILEEMKAYLETGIDGLFTDNPDIGVLAVEQYMASK
ncbi:glycerophosphodiester phosphodiesterase [Cumulibacter soli]|uniref:glycerophosphodiester phosphodiesterase n=1 Tax=Cumulibacter soli TaxID=2546344 RepID=UPI0010684E98|nr:glycerophosphodiester phosphodiesterase [Cumulibacter soli]